MTDRQRHRQRETEIETERQTEAEKVFHTLCIAMTACILAVLSWNSMHSCGLLRVV